MGGYSFIKILVVAMVAASFIMPTGDVSAAIPCGELPVIEADPNMPIPLIYIQLPVSVEEAFSRGQESDREHTAELTEDENHSVTEAAENQFRCLGYGNFEAFANNATPHMRVQAFALSIIDTDTEYIALESMRLISLGEPIGLADGRFLIDFAVVVDSNQYLAGEMVFLDQNASLYLDSTHLTDSTELSGDVITLDLAENFTREIKIVEVSEGDLVVFNNTETTTGISISIAAADGTVVFEGFQKDTDAFTGGSRNTFVVHDLEDGQYIATIIFELSGIKYDVTLVVGE